MTVTLDWLSVAVVPLTMEGDIEAANVMSAGDSLRFVIDSSRLLEFPGSTMAKFVEAERMKLADCEERSVKRTDLEASAP